MAVSLREYRARIKSTESMKKITRAMELIAASRIIKAQQRAQAAAPYARELTRAVSAVATYSSVDHPMTREPENPTRAAVLIVTSDRGLAGRLLLERAQGVRAARPDAPARRARRSTTYICGRKGEAYFKFRERPVVPVWTGFSDQPSYDVAQEIGQALIDAFLAEEGDGDDDRAGVDEVHVVYTRFRSMMVQEPTAVRLLPLEVVEGEEKPSDEESAPALRVRAVAGAGVRRACCRSTSSRRIFFALLQAAASELAARQKAMKSATDNADELIKKYTRIANQARQAGITQEISEIVGGVNALADANAAAAE